MTLRYVLIFNAQISCHHFSGWSICFMKPISCVLKSGTFYLVGSVSGNWYSGSENSQNFYWLSPTLRPCSAPETHVPSLVFMRDRFHCFDHLANPKPASCSFLCLLTPHNWPPHPFCWLFLVHYILCSNITVWILGGLGARRSCSNFCRFQL